MRGRLIARGALTTAALTLAGSAAAQSTVTLFGIADAAYVNQGNRPGGSGRAIQSGAWQTSRLGFRGTEDLGNGYSAVFDIAQSLALDTGAQANAGRLFDRNAFVGIGSAATGTLTLGRQTTVLTEGFAATDPLRANNSATNLNVRLGYLAGPAAPIAGSFGANPGFAGNALDRQDNAVKYSLRKGGFTGTAMMAFGESATAGASANRSWGALAGWDGAGFGLRGAFARFEDATGAQLDAGMVGATWRNDSLRLAATWTRNAIEGNAAAYHGQETGIQSAGLTWSATPALDLTFAAYRARRGFDNAADQVARKFYLVPECKLSKRTTLYAVADAERFNAGGAALDTGTALKAGARSSMYLAAGVSHTF
ncbi:porin [Derxia lacustris]|uniref:porin n=1 Tax=Derxia lacustris TaxID=764842 RepID=UPI000A16CBB1|nr:porin [Derxia lacustris]